MSYNAFARFYDSLTGNIGYENLAEYYDRLNIQFGGKRGILLDLACGTGSLSVLFADMGYDVIAVDCSADMLSAAKPHEGVQYLCQDMTRLDLFGTIDTIVCALDSLNHLDGADELRKAVSRAALFCDNNAVFIFDVNTPYKHEHILADNTFVYETDDVLCVWENEYTGGGRTEITLDFFERQPRLGEDVYSRSSDEFTETAYSRELIENILTEAGFTLCAVYEYPTTDEPSSVSEKLTFVAKMEQSKNKEF